MFDIGWQELFVVAVLALIVVGPKDLPRALKTVMRGIKKIRELANEFQSGVDEMAREADIDDIQKTIEGAGDNNIKAQIKSTLDPNGEIESETNISNIERDMSSLDQRPSSDNQIDKPGPTKKSDTAQAKTGQASAFKSNKSSIKEITPPKTDVGNIERQES